MDFFFYVEYWYWYWYWYFIKNSSNKRARKYDDANIIAYKFNAALFSSKYTLLQFTYFLFTPNLRKV